MKNSSAFLILFCILVGGFVVRPIYNESQSLLATKAQLENDKKNKAQEFKTLQENVKQGETSDYQQILPDYDQEGFLTDIETLTQNNGFSTENIGFSLGYNGEVKAEQITANFTIKGELQDIYRFLVAVETHPNFLGLESFGINYDNKDNINDLDVTLYRFYQSAS